MVTLFSLKDIPLPKNWHDKVKSGVLHVISLAYLAITYTRGWAYNCKNTRIRLAAENDHLENEISFLKEEMRIKDTRMLKINPHNRPHYPATERFAILEMKAARGWSQSQTAQKLLIKPSTIASWLGQIDESPTLIKTRVPVNKSPQFVRYIVQRLKILCPKMGKKRIAQILARAGLHIGVTTVATILKEKLRPDPTDIASDDSKSKAVKSQNFSGRTVTAKCPNNVWLVDLTAVPISSGFWTTWFPHSLPQLWPFNWWVAVTIDLYSRRLMGFTILKKPPTSLQIRSFLGRTMSRVQATPKYFVTDKGTQFWSAGFKKWCKKKGIKPRYGAVGKQLSKRSSAPE